MIRVTRQKIGQVPSATAVAITPARVREAVKGAVEGAAKAKWPGAIEVDLVSGCIRLLPPGTAPAQTATNPADLVDMSE